MDYSGNKSETLYPELGAQPARPAILDGESDAMSPHAVIFAATELPQRYMFSDSTQQNAVALQRDVLARTWTRRRAGEVYPTYHSSLREQFVKDMGSLPSIHPRQQHRGLAGATVRGFLYQPDPSQ